MALNKVQLNILSAIEAIADKKRATGDKYPYDREVAESLELDLQRVRDHLELVQQYGYIGIQKSFSIWRVWLTATGRLALHDPDFFSKGSQGAGILRFADSVNMNNEFETISAKLLDFELHGITKEQKAVMNRALERLMAEAAAERDAKTALRIQGLQERLKALATKDSEHQDHPSRLRELIDRCFDDSELRNLCFDLHIDYDALPGETKSDKCRELTAHCQRHERIPDLIAELKQQRKNVSWDEAGV